MVQDSVRSTLAGNLRRARERSGLSLSELSRRSGIGKATLSALEAAAGNPTIETVFSLSRALELPISDLLERRSAAPISVVRGAEADVLSGAAVDLRALRTIEAGDVRMEVYDQVVRPDAKQVSDGHVGVEHTIVQAGTLEVEVDGSRVELGPGDYVGFDARLPHSYRAVGDEPVRSVLLLQSRDGGALCSGLDADS